MLREPAMLGLRRALTTDGAPVRLQPAPQPTTPQQRSSLERPASDTLTLTVTPNHGCDTNRAFSRTPLRETGQLTPRPLIRILARVDWDSAVEESMDVPQLDALLRAYAGRRADLDRNGAYFLGAIDEVEAERCCKTLLLMAIDRRENNA